MGYWGNKIFQSDTALDFIDEITGDADVELYMFDNDAAVTAAKDKLDAGLLDVLVAKYEAAPLDMWDDPNHKIFLLVALAMQTGAAVNADLRASVKELIPTIATPNQAKKQMRVALRVYKSGERYIFDSPGLYDTMITSANKQASTAAKEEDIPADAICTYCLKKETELKPGNYLTCCSQCRCDEVRYCSRACRKNDWKEHKITCTLGMKRPG